MRGGGVIEKSNREEEKTTTVEDVNEYLGRKKIELKAGNRSALFSFDEVIRIAKHARNFKPDSDTQISATEVRESVRPKKGHYIISEQKPVLSYEHELGSKKKVAADSGFYRKVLLGCEITLKIIENRRLASPQNAIGNVGRIVQSLCQRMSTEGQMKEESDAEFNVRIGREPEDLEKSSIWLLLFLNRPSEYLPSLYDSFVDIFNYNGATCLKYLNHFGHVVQYFKTHNDTFHKLRESNSWFDWPNAREKAERAEILIRNFKREGRELEIMDKSQRE